MNLRQVEIFHSVMVHGTTQKAAESLHISQPGVSKALQDLEQSVGFALFDRVRKRLQPTAEGRLFFREVETNFAALANLHSAAGRIRDFGSGQLRIATLSALSTNVVPAALKRFHDANPDVSITLQARMSSTVKDLVLSGQCDLGLAADEIDTTGVDARPFSVFPAMIALPSDDPLCARERLEIEDLQGRNFISLSPEDTSRRQLDTLLEEAGVRPKVVLETPFANTVCSLVQAGLGLGLINPLSAAPFLGRGVTLRPFGARVEFRTLLVLPAGLPVARKVSDCIAILEDEARRQNARNGLDKVGPAAGG
ncbi:MAG: LysR family transcriptional regulator [Rhodobacteraceae bacterium]|nr:LysR family transcriptional regulator [Paracoccaceae bacterium]MBR9821749.1 LysR family transcriptional regulator [Paracoccaceae bacterium]